jgi:quinolinate synthase
MAETADILTGREQSVILPNMAAGCSMADMARTDDAQDCWDQITSLFDGPGEFVPITYMNSTAAIKALCGRNGGIVCTSSNAKQAFEWAYARGRRVLFLPDQHLGRNTGVKMGMPLEDMVLWSPFRQMGGLTPDQVRRTRLILWQGHCSVHTRFTVEQISQAREKHPGVKVIVHPECTMEAVNAADMNGSTEFIARTIESAPAGSVWGIGTEINLVNRLAKENPDKTVFCLDPIVCPCATMYRIHPAYLLWVLEGLMAGLIINKISVPEPTRSEALLALERMLEVGG